MIKFLSYTILLYFVFIKANGCPMPFFRKLEFKVEGKKTVSMSYDDGLVIATDKADGFFITDGEHVFFPTDPLKLLPKDVRDIKALSYIYHQGKYWLGTEGDGVLVFDSSLALEQVLSFSKGEVVVTSVALLENEVVFGTVSHGLLRLVNNTLMQWDGMEKKRITRILEAGDGEYYLLTLNGEVLKYKVGQDKWIPMPFELKTPISDLLVFPEANKIVIASYAEGLFVCDLSFQNLTLVATDDPVRVNDMVLSDSGIYLAMSNGLGFLPVEKNRGTDKITWVADSLCRYHPTSRPSMGLPAYGVLALCDISDGLLIATTSGWVTMEGVSSGYRFESLPLLTADRHVSGYAEYGATQYFSTLKGRIMIKKEGQWLPWPTKTKHKVINDIKVFGALLCVATDYGFFTYDLDRGNEEKSYRKAGRSMATKLRNHCLWIQEDGDSSLAVGTKDGLMHFTQDDGVTTYSYYIPNYDYRLEVLPLSGDEGVLPMIIHKIKDDIFELVEERHFFRRLEVHEDWISPTAYYRSSDGLFWSTADDLFYMQHRLNGDFGEMEKVAAVEGVAAIVRNPKGNIVVVTSAKEILWLDDERNIIGYRHITTPLEFFKVQKRGGELGLYLSEGIEWVNIDDYDGYEVRSELFVSVVDAFDSKGNKLKTIFHPGAEEGFPASVTEIRLYGRPASIFGNPYPNWKIGQASMHRYPMEIQISESNHIIEMEDGTSSFQLLAKLQKPINTMVYMASGAAMLIIVVLIVWSMRKKQTQLGRVSDTDNLLSSIDNILEANYAESTFGMVALATALGMSKSSLYDKFPSALGCTPREYLRNYRLDKAKDKLVLPHAQVAQVAYEVGFEDSKYFSKCFKARFGVTPTAFRQEKKV